MSMAVPNFSIYDSAFSGVPTRAGQDQSFPPDCQEKATFSHSLSLLSFIVSRSASLCLPPRFVPFPM